MGVDTVLDTAMVDTVARDPLKLMPMPTTAVDAVMVDMEVTDMVDTEDTAMVDTVAREKLMLKLTTEVLDTDTVPDTDSDLTDMVDTVPDTDADMLVTDTAVDTDTDTESKHFPLQTNQRNHS